MTKKCTSCKEIKDVSEFNSNKSKPDGKATECKPCAALYNRLYHQANSEKINITNAAWAARNVTLMRGYRRKWEENNPDKIAYYNESHASEIAEYQKQYRLKHKIERNQRDRERKEKDPNYKLACNLRCRVNLAIRANQKKGSPIRDLGCSITKLKRHLESLFTAGMTWANWGHGRGKWNIDHIMPLCKFDLTDRQQFLLASHYLNLQPLWFEQNMAKNRFVK